ncbi:hypothetical protein PYCCODRAFT_165797 [Trametes coccinea BRFM310]|uniref:Uncharacterized protein n=1 Tax=Trametes coccinea (strain BRFM310) TaxID=1353009 RepID=A0A1Y2IS95_TRAC3|nr:hypothetical protein PYCCODRAFT_165797 [Trametes coccinea BRFM310]
MHAPLIHAAVPVNCLPPTVRNITYGALPAWRRHHDNGNCLPSLSPRHDSRHAGLPLPRRQRPGPCCTPRLARISSSACSCPALAMYNSDSPSRDSAHAQYPCHCLHGDQQRPPRRVHTPVRMIMWLHEQATAAGYPDIRVRPHGCSRNEAERFPTVGISRQIRPSRFSAGTYICMHASCARIRPPGSLQPRRAALRSRLASRVRLPRFGGGCCCLRGFCGRMRNGDGAIGNAGGVSHQVLGCGSAWA